MSTCLLSTRLDLPLTDSIANSRYWPFCVALQPHERFSLFNVTLLNVAGEGQALQSPQSHLVCPQRLLQDPFDQREFPRRTPECRAEAIRLWTPAARAGPGSGTGRDSRDSPTMDVHRQDRNEPACGASPSGQVFAEHSLMMSALILTKHIVTIHNDGL